MFSILSQMLRANIFPKIIYSYSTQIKIFVVSNFERLNDQNLSLSIRKFKIFVKILEGLRNFTDLFRKCLIRH